MALGTSSWNLRVFVGLKSLLPGSGHLLAPSLALVAAGSVGGQQDKERLQASWECQARVANWAALMPEAGLPEGRRGPPRAAGALLDPSPPQEL